MEKMGGKTADQFKDIFYCVSLGWPLEPGESVQVVSEWRGVWRAHRIEWAITMQSGQRRDRFYGDRWGRNGHTNTKTKRQIELMALSSGGQLWLKQTGQMSHKTTSKRELIMSEATPPKKTLSWSQQDPKKACQTVFMRHFGWQWEDVTDISYLHANSIPAGPSRLQRAESVGGFFRQHGG